MYANLDKLQTTMGQTKIDFEGVPSFYAWK